MASVDMNSKAQSDAVITESEQWLHLVLDAL